MLRRYEQPVANALVEKRFRVRKSPETLAEKVGQVRFEITDFFSRERSKQVIVSRSQVWKVR